MNSGRFSLSPEGSHRCTACVASHSWNPQPFIEMFIKASSVSTFRDALQSVINEPGKNCLAHNMLSELEEPGKFQQASEGWETCLSSQ